MPFFFNHPAPTEIYTLSLHDALPICPLEGDRRAVGVVLVVRVRVARRLDDPRDLGARSEEHTSELQSRRDLVCRLLLEKKNMEVEMRDLSVLPWIKTRLEKTARRRRL